MKSLSLKVIEYIQPIILVLIGSVLLTTGCKEDPEYEMEISIVNKSDRDVYISLQYPKETPRWVLNYPDLVPDYSTYDIQFIAADDKYSTIIKTSSKLDKQDWYLLVIYPETVEKYTLNEIKYCAIYDEFITIGYRIPIYQKKITYYGNGKIDNDGSRE